MKKTMKKRIALLMIVCLLFGCAAGFSEAAETQTETAAVQTAEVQYTIHRYAEGTNTRVAGDEQGKMASGCYRKLSG